MQSLYIMLVGFLVLQNVKKRKKMENFRNFWCPYYDECLDEAIRQNEPGFSCADCESEDKKIYPSDDELFEEVINIHNGLHSAYKIYDSDYRKGPDERLDSFAEYAYKYLPENIAKKAIPSETALKKLNIAKEPKNYQKEPDITHVDSLGSAFINPNWAHCGEDHLAEDLEKSKSWVQKGEAEGWLASDKYLGFKWFAQNSADFLKRLIETGQLKNYIRSWRDKTRWTDQSGLSL